MAPATSKIDFFATIANGSRQFTNVEKRGPSKMLQYDF